MKTKPHRRDLEQEPGGLTRVRISIDGSVQGVGFRPFIYRLAGELSLTGWVSNASDGVILEAEGPAERIRDFIARIPEEKPPQSTIERMHSDFLAPRYSRSFQIQESQKALEPTAVILPDLATCADCLEEIFNPNDRRYLYPFTNCTHCGPRYSILESLPYDRPNTSMKGFQMCGVCQREYKSPVNRRFHAQPNACPRCGPRLELWSAEGKRLGLQHLALMQLTDEVRRGSIVAVKGLGGFHLIVDARSGRAVSLLRERKQRPQKPFALLFPSLELIRAICHVSNQEEALLKSQEAPIVLLRRKKGGKNSLVSDPVAPGNPYLGVMLPYTPFYHVLMRELDFPVVATSGNLSDEPICTDEKEALVRLRGIADFFLVHDRPIVRPVDDSVVQVVAGRPMMLRRARGYAPLPLRTEKAPGSILALGGHLKNTIALQVEDKIFISQHIGDLSTPQSMHAFQAAIAGLRQIYPAPLSQVVCDAHPDYRSSRHAEKESAVKMHVQHHHAHVAAVMAEHGITDNVLGLAWDGTGFGPDGVIWGGEFLIADLEDSRRFASLRPFMLPGGEQAIEEPRRAAIGICYALFGEGLFEEKTLEWLPLFRKFSLRERHVLVRMLSQKIQSPFTSSMGRLFDAVAALLGLKEKATFEGEGAIALEFAVRRKKNTGRYAYEVFPDERQPDLLRVDWGPMIRQILEEAGARRPVGEIAAKFHHTLIEMGADMALRSGQKRVVLGGGCFQNRVLSEGLLRRLRKEGFKVYRAEQVPPNDGGISFGQAAIATHRLLRQPGKKEEAVCV